MCSAWLAYLNLLISEPTKSRAERLASEQRAKQHRLANYNREFKYTLCNANYLSAM